MNNRAVVKKPSRAIEPTGSNVLMPLTQPGETNTAMTCQILLPVNLRLSKDQASAFLKAQSQAVSQSPAATNAPQIIIYNNTINNYHGTPSDTPIEKRQGTSENRPNQAHQPGPLTRPAIEGPSSSVISVPSASNPKRTFQSAGQNGTQDRSHSSRATEMQAPRAQGAPKMERTTSAPPTRPPTGPTSMVRPSHTQDVKTKSAFTNSSAAPVPVAQIPEQPVRPVERQPRENKPSGVLDNIRDRFSTRGNGSRQMRKENTTSADTPPARGTRPQNQDNPQPPRQQNQAPSEHMRASNSGQQIPLSHHRGEAQPRAQAVSVGAARGRPVMNEGTPAAPTVLEPGVLKRTDMWRSEYDPPRDSTC
jgi:hypothetical protein